MNFNFHPVQGIQRAIDRFLIPTEVPLTTHQPAQRVVSVFPAATAADVLFSDISYFKNPYVGISTCSTLDDFFMQLKDIRENRDNYMHGWKIYLLDELFGLPPGLSTERRVGKLFFDDKNRVRKFTYKAKFPSQFQNTSHSLEAEVNFNGGFDACVVAVASDGSIAFNPPGSPHDSVTRYQTLSDPLKKGLESYVGEGSSIPHSAFVVGLDVIRRSRRIVAVVNDTQAGEVLLKAYQQGPSVDNPASVLLYCPNVTIIASPKAKDAIDPFNDYGWSTHSHR